MRHREVVKLTHAATFGRRVRVILRNGAGHILGNNFFASEASNYGTVRMAGRRIDIDYRLIKKIVIGKKVR